MLSCTFISPLEKDSFSDLKGIIFTTVTGERGILKNHAPSLFQLKDNSLVRLKTGKKEVRFTIGTGGFLKFNDNKATILSQNFWKTSDY